MVDFPAPPLREATTIVRTSCPFPSAGVLVTWVVCLWQAKSDRVVTCDHVSLVDHTNGQCLIVTEARGTTHYLQATQRVTSLTLLPTYATVL